ncbi:MAG: acyl-CoA dehydrogenase family protein [Protaetiibacter sp.]
MSLTAPRVASFSRDAFDDFLATLRESTPRRERERELLGPQLAALRDLGFTALRVPAEHGGDPVPLEELFALLIDLAAADPSLAHIQRGHLAFVESLRVQGTDAPHRWWDRVLQGDFVGNAQSERQDTARLETRISREGGELLLTGTKYYTTGSIYADWIHLAALDGEERVAVTVSAHQEGVRSVDDWDGFGQPLTGSGTTVFDRARVEPEDLVPPHTDAARWHHLGSVFQLSLLAVIAGVAQRALEDTVDFVRPRRRTFGFAGETLPREDPLVQLVVGQLSVAAATTRRLVVSVAADLGRATDGDVDADELQRLQLEVFRVQEVVPALVLDATTRLFEVGGASAVSRELALDRHWRNVRTIASHNPVIQRTRALGQFELLGTLPDWKAPGA